MPSSERGAPGDLADAALADALRAGDEAAFQSLVKRHHGAMLRLARSYVSSHAVAEEVVGDTWLAVVRGIERFEGRSSLRTWMFSILINRAKTRGQRERRTTPLSAVLMDGEGGPSVSPERFFEQGRTWAGHWIEPPSAWDDVPAGQLTAKETRDFIERVVVDLPLRQQQVVVLRDLEGWSSAEVCAALDLSEANQRVLLHRGRSRIRAALEEYFEQGGRDDS